MKNLYVAFRRGLVVGVAYLLSQSMLFAQVKGTVYRDFNQSGTQTASLPEEPGEPNIVVRAYVNFSSTPISTTTDSNGAYQFSAADVPANAKVRIEFSGLADGYFFGAAGADDRSNVRFVIAGPAATGIDVGINYPTDYCQNGEVSTIIPCFVNGDPISTLNADGSPADPANRASGADVLVAFPYSATGLAGPGNFPPAHLATAGQVGSIWGVGLLRAEKKVITSAAIKRHTGLGSLGTGGIYITDIAALTATPTAVQADYPQIITKPFFDFQADLGVATGADPHSGLSGNKLEASADPGSMVAMGRIGLGGIEISDDSKTLYAVNLFDRKLYGVFIDSPARKPGPGDVKSWAMDQSGCPNGDYRPWGVYSYRKIVYVGGVCSGENRTSKIGSTPSATGDLAATLPDTAGLKLIIQRVDPRIVGATFQTVLTYPLTFPRGAADLTDNCADFKYWLPWNNDFPVGCNNTGMFVMWPQPMVTDLAFDVDGSMIIGMLDRFGHLAGVQNHNPQGTGLFNGFTGGDILRAAPLNAAGTAYKMESNGSVGGDFVPARTAGSNQVPGTGISVQGTNNNQGPGGGEFYYNDQWAFSTSSTKLAHDEVTNGSLMVVPGRGEVMTSAFDPITGIYQSGGMKVFKNRDGSIVRNYALFANLGGGPDGNFGKVSGLGDGKVLCDMPGLEIGNRVWFDDNRNGIQDAYEPGVDGVVLELFDMGAGGTKVASTTSANGGQYVFNKNNVPGGPRYNRSYEIRLAMAQLPSLDLAAQKPTGGPGARRAATTRDYYISPQLQASGVDGAIRDNNAVQIGTNAVIQLTTGSFGENNYDNDFAIYSCPTITAQFETLSVCADAAKIPDVPFDGANFALVDNVQFVLFTSPQSGTAMYTGGTVLATLTPTNPVSQVVSLTAANISTQNNTGAPIQYFIYGIISPAPIDPTCRVSSVTKLTILPKPTVAVTPSSATLTCNKLTATLQVLNPTPGTVYGWVSPPNGTTTAGSSLLVSAPGVYTVTASLSACAASSGTALVSEDKITQPVTVNDAVLSCRNPTASLTALVGGQVTTQTVSWKGPNGFTSTQNPISVTLPGTYSATVTFANGCTVVSTGGTVTQGASTTPDVEAFGGVKLCNTCSVTLVAEASGVSFYWTGPGNFTSTEQNPVVTLVGNYTVTVYDIETGCPNQAEVVVEPPAGDQCVTTLSISPGASTICSGGPAPAIVATASTTLVAGQQIQFVRFKTLQTGTNMYVGGTVLATLSPNASNQAILPPAAFVGVTNTASQPVDNYIYAILTPVNQARAECKPSALFTVTVQPGGCLSIQGTRVR
ncbi:SdrD B-like domain-containing protein [Fibrella aquatilis]|uniref:SD-repeat containing protein B domain-containing protein n=1 Tax=Fibrella aquatilis TaxID=2817059 RepID=A0A939G6B1_9BACT|nr:SdrD B-like domain-containing protein [Fibrella aquatilis]MBO0930992.1 hypothetical protein [Fibrella aquatilis]